MVKYQEIDLDLVFGALSDSTRRDILQRLKKQNLSVGEIAQKYKISLAAVSKHIASLQKAGLVHKRIDGTTHYIQLDARPVLLVGDYLEQFENAWKARLQKLKRNLESKE